MVFLAAQIVGGFTLGVSSAIADSTSNFSASVLKPIYGEDGKWYWPLKISGSSHFAGSWEKRTGTFENSEALIAAIQAESQCRATTVQSFLNGFADQQSFLATVRYTSATTWVSDQLQSEIRSNCIETSEWTPKAKGNFDSQGNWVAWLPYSEYPAGNHTFFVVAADYLGSSSADACKKTWPDGTWNGFDCQAKIGSVTELTVTVPKHTLSQSQLQGPPVAVDSFFDQSPFSTLKPIDLAVIVPAVSHSAGVVGVLTILVSFPTILLSKAIDEIHGKISKRDRFAWMGFSVTGLWALALFFIAAIIDGFSDPTFGFTYKALRVLITGFLGFVVMDFGRNQIAFWLTKNHSGQEYPLLSARPFFLLVVAATVLFARITNIDPTMIFGTVIGLELGSKISRESKGVVKLVTTGYTFLIGLLSWIGYSWLSSIHLYTAAQVNSGDISHFQLWLGMCQVTTGEFLSMLAVSAFSTVPLSMLPFAGLGGKPLIEWKRWVWVVTYFFGLLAFVIVVLPMPKVWSQPSEAVSTWIAVLAAYIVIALVAFGLVTWRNSRESKLAR